MGKLYLLPNVLEETLPWEPFLPVSVKEAVQKLEGLICESEKAGRRYLRKFLSHDDMAKCPLCTLNEHTDKKELDLLLEPMQRWEIWGLVSDTGLACIADPGSDLISRAREKGIKVETFAGPSSIIMGLQLSGFFGQRFSFHGYLPREVPDLEKKLKELEVKSKLETQIWIEAPYRSSKMLETLKQILSPNTKLCVAVNLTTPSQRVESM